MLREIAHYAALFVGVLFSVVVAVFGISLGAIASRLKQLDADLQTEVGDLVSQISDLKQSSHDKPHQLLKLASAAVRKAKRRSRHLRRNRWLLSLWGALYSPSLMLLSAFVMFVFTTIGILGDWEESIFFIGVIFTLYSLMHLALVVDLVHQAVLLPEPPAEPPEELRPKLDVSFLDHSKVIAVNRLSNWPIQLYFRNGGEGQAGNPSISVIVPTTFTHVSGNMRPQIGGSYPGQNLYYQRLENPLESEANIQVTVGTVNTPTEPGNFKIFILLKAANSRIIRKSLQVLVQ